MQPENLISAQAPAPSAAIHENHHKRRKLTAWLLGYLGGGLVGVVTGLFFSGLVMVALVIFRGGEKLSGPSIYSPLIKKAEDLAFLEKEDGLASLEIIGRGGCGQVYKAELPGSNGKFIAIKKVLEPPQDAAELIEEDTNMLNGNLRQIRSEIKTVGIIRHRNLVPLMAHVPGLNCHYLVYEYMKNGSLQDIMKALAEGNIEFDWLLRFKITIGVASELEYLHMNNSP